MTASAIPQNSADDSQPHIVQPKQSHRFWQRTGAQRYDRAITVLNSNFGQMVRLVTEDVRGRNKVLEIAAGTGLVTIEVVKVVSELTATDLSPDMLSILSTRLAENNHANVQTEIADVMSLQYSDQTFDAVIAANILHLLPDLPGALRQIRRVLKPDGILCVPTFAHGQSPWTQVVSRAMAVVGFPVVARFDGESFQKVLQENGFEVINERIVPGLLPIVHVTAKPMEGWKE